jgi:hypothetical protein
MTNKKGSWGFTLRNNRGEALGAGAGRIEHVVDALHSDRSLLSWSQSRSRVLVSQLLVHALKGDNQDLAAIGSMFREIKAVARILAHYL